MVSIISVSVALAIYWGGLLLFHLSSSVKGNYTGHVFDHRTVHMLPRDMAQGNLQSILDELHFPCSTHHSSDLIKPTSSDIDTYYDSGSSP